MKAIHGGGEFSLGSLAGLKLIPERAKFGGLSGRQEAEDAIGGEALPGVLIGHIFRIVSKGVSGIDFDQIMNDYHLKYPEEIEVRDVGVLCEGDDEQAEPP